MTVVFSVIANDTPQHINIIPADFEYWPRLANLSWVLYDKDEKPLRGFSFNITPDGWEMVKPHPDVDMDILRITGHKAAAILRKFFDDCEQCDRLVSLDLAHDYSIVAAEAYRYQVFAKKQVESKIDIGVYFPSPESKMYQTNNPMGKVQHVAHRYFELVKAEIL